MIASILTVLLGEAFTAVGQIFFKKNTNRIVMPAPNDWVSYGPFIKRILFLPGIWLGLGFMAVGLVIWLIALSWFDLSLVFPIGSVQYVLILFSSRIFLHEKIDRMKFAGTLLVVAGILMIAFS